MFLYSSGTASDSICPKGWRLPGYDGSGSWYEMLKLYSSREDGDATSLEQGDTIALFSPLTFLRSGRYNYSSGSLDLRTSVGSYWSGHYYLITNSHYLLFSSTNLSPQDGYTRGYGYTLRCLARQGQKETPLFRHCF